MTFDGSRTGRRPRLALLGLVAVGLVWLFVVSPARAALRRTTETAGRELRYWASRLGARQDRWARRQLSEPVPDAVVADRVRTALLALERRWDIRRIHVDAEAGVVVLHGQVPSSRAAGTVERMTVQVPDVAGVESYLHVGPICDGARPSPGMRYPEPSDARRRLLRAAYEAGAPADRTLPVVRGVLALLADRIPPGELARLTAHLPRDVRALCQAPTRNGHQRRPVHTLADMVDDLAPVTAPLPRHQARQVAEAVLGTLHDLVPEEAGDIASVLPDDLRKAWLASTG